MRKGAAVFAGRRCDRRAAPPSAPPDSDRLEHRLEEAVTLRQDYDSSASKLKSLERQVKMLRLEKDDVHKVSATRRPVFRVKLGGAKAILASAAHRCSRGRRSRPWKEKKKKGSRVAGVLFVCVCVSGRLEQQLLEALERLRTQSKELKEAHSQRRSALQEFLELSERTAELRASKQRLARQLRDKEEETDALLQKMDVLRQDARKSDKSRKEVRKGGDGGGGTAGRRARSRAAAFTASQLEAQLDRVTAEAAKERKLKEHSEVYAKQLEAELQRVKVRACEARPPDAICPVRPLANGFSRARGPFSLNRGKERRPGGPSLSGRSLA